MSNSATEKSHDLDRQKLAEQEKIIEDLNRCVEDKNKVIATLGQSVIRKSLVNSKSEWLEVTDNAKLLKTKSSNSWIIELPQYGSCKFIAIKGTYQYRCNHCQLIMVRKNRAKLIKNVLARSLCRLNSSAAAVFCCYTLNFNRSKCAITNYQKN